MDTIAIGRRVNPNPDALAIKITRLNKAVIFTAAILFHLSLFASIAYANGELTDLFSTKAFQGSWEVINKFNWLGWLMNFLISTFCLLGLWLVFFQRMISLLYLSSRNLWDNVYEVKGSAKGEALFGMKALFTRFIKAEDGTGADAFITFFYGLLPNVKKYSDYNDERRLSGLEDTDNALNYILKTFPMTVLLIFFLALGWKGTLGQIYGTVVDGMTAVADNAVTINLAGYVDRIFAAGNHYRFTIDAEGTNLSTMQQQCATRAYQEIVAKGKVIDGDLRNDIGRQVEERVKDGITNELGATVTGKEAGFTDADWRMVTPRIVLAPTQAESDNVFSFEVPSGVFGDSAYINVYLNADKSYGDYFNREYIEQEGSNK